MKPKSESRKLAELIARQRGIKVKSAQSWLSRVASGKVKSPKYGLTDYARRKVKKYTAARRPAAAKPVSVPKQKRAAFDPSEWFTIPVTATFDFYGSDRRHRRINLSLSGRELNKFMNAKTADAALKTLAASRMNRFLEGAKITDLESFGVESTEYGPEFFD